MSAAVAAKSMQTTFPSLKFVLMVGVGGGIPSQENDIRLSDIVVSLPNGQHGGVVQYDLGRMETDGFDRLGTLNKPLKLLRTAVATLKATRNLGKDITGLIIGAIEKDEEDEDEWTCPSKAQDILFQPMFTHIGNSPTCALCAEKTGEIVPRTARKTQNPRIFYGNIASGNMVVKNAINRDKFAKLDNVICFEMEAAGLMDDIPCLVIRGISDYADSHKNWKWQPYAATVAAAYAKKLLPIVSPDFVDGMDLIKSK